MHFKIKVKARTLSGARALSVVLICPGLAFWWQSYEIFYVESRWMSLCWVTWRLIQWNIYIEIVAYTK